LLARASEPLDGPRTKRLAMNTGIEEEDIISAPDVLNVYEIPLNFEKGQLTKRILQKLKLRYKKPRLGEWRGWVKDVERSKKPVKIAIVGKYFTSGAGVLSDSYISVIEAIKHASYRQRLKPEIHWLDAGKVLGKTDILKDYQGIIVPGGFGVRDIEGKIAAIQYARENKIPYLGLCYGLQMAVIEYARNVLKLKDANSTEVDEKTKFPVVHVMPEQAKKLLAKDYGGTMRLGAWECDLLDGSLVRKLYGKSKISERHRHRFEFNNDFKKNFSVNGMLISGTSPDGRLVEIIEINQKYHPFFVGTQFHPELKSRPLAPHPIFSGFIKAASDISLEN
jgi:CTP synthase